LWAYDPEGKQNSSRGGRRPGTGTAGAAAEPSTRTLIWAEEAPKTASAKESSDGGAEPSADRRAAGLSADPRRARASERAHPEVGRDVRARAEDAQQRCRLLLSAARPVAHISRLRRGGDGHRRRR